MSFIKIKTLILLSLLVTSQNLLAISYPGKKAGSAKSSSKSQQYVLENNLLKAKWTLKNGKLQAPTITNKVSGEKFTSTDQLFAIATKAQVLDTERVVLAFRRSKTSIEAAISSDGQSWENIASFPISKFKSPLKALRIGKVSNKGQAVDYGSAGDLGICEFQEIFVRDNNKKLDNITAKPSKIHKSKRAKTDLSINNERITINAHANSATFAEYKINSNWQQVSCKVKKATDKGMTWGPGLSLHFEDGQFLVLNVRAKGQYTVISSKDEKLISRDAKASLNCDLSANDFTLSSAPKLRKSKSAKAITALLKHPKTGLSIVWTASLKNGSNYIKQDLRFKTSKALTIHGLEFINGSSEKPQQIGTVPGSPVASKSLFFGVEMPFTANYIDQNTFRSGFPCNLPIKKGDKYDFSSVIGVYPKKQLRRAFNFYLERERASPSFQFLHYNCWYDFGLNPNKDNFSKVIRDYHREMTVERGVTIDSFVMDDGWDDVREGLWEFSPTKFPNGFDEVTAEAKKANSNLGIWISPLGGYSGANERTQHAKDMGLITKDLDLSQPAYKKWFYDKCLAFMKDYGVNHYKWDKAGTGVNPHFMSLLQIGKKLKKHNPKLFINVTVGTWPSPFWLNHIDSTWRTGTGDVAWYGVGDDREKWLTFRDWGCYTKFVEKAPLYPITAVMHHGLVAGRHYQGVRVAKAGVKMKNAARSFFGTGATLQELYLTPDLMTEQAWDEVAEAAKWSKKNADILVDSHWVGGNPLDLGTYGWASWSPKKSLLTLRNSSDKPTELTIDLAEELEVPAGFASTFRLKNAYKDQTFKEQVIKGKFTFKLKPFEVLCFDLFPVK